MDIHKSLNLYDKMLSLKVQILLFFRKFNTQRFGAVQKNTQFECLSVNVLQQIKSTFNIFFSTRSKLYRYVETI